MELILLKGKEDAGKTTTAAMVHDKLVKRGAYEKEYIELHKKYKRGEKGWDFRSELELKNKIIHIISEGDEVKFFNNNILNYKEESSQDNIVDVLVICVRTEKSNQDIGIYYELVKKHFVDYLKEENGFYINREGLDKKEKIADEIAEHICNIINGKQNEN